MAVRRRTTRKTKPGGIMNIVNAALGGTVGTVAGGFIGQTVGAGSDISNGIILAAATAAQMTSKSATVQYMAAGAAGAAGAQLLGGLLSGITGGSGEGMEGFNLYQEPVIK